MAFKLKTSFVEPIGERWFKCEIKYCEGLLTRNKTNLTTLYSKILANTWAEMQERLYGMTLGSTVSIGVLTAYVH